jgi:amino acid adenylation domain-containing protein
MSTKSTTERSVLTFPALLDEQAARSPDAAAIVCEGTQFTFRQARERVNRVANFLLARGARRGTRIGLMFQRGEQPLETLLLLLGILKAGAVYVPLEASLPPHRLSFILEDAAISLVLTLRPLASRLPATSVSPQLAVHCMDELGAEVNRASGESPPEVASPEEGDIAYILYTTGSSTGHPKGVVVGHGSLAHFARVQNAALGVRPGDRATQFFSLGFDASLSDLTMLAAGASLYPLPANALLGGQALLDFLRESAITVGTFVPSIWLTLPSYDLSALRILIVGGEVCPPSLVEKSWRPGRCVFNAYGLTETTVCISLGECEPSGRTPHIGRPFPGIEATIRDGQLRPVPPGVPGHLCVSGACLALGYTDERLTRQRFVPDPLAPSTRLFLTNDEAVASADGTITFLGRLDKARRLKLPGGKLVELDEVEAALLARPDVRECAVEAFEGRIVAFVSLDLADRAGAPAVADEEEERQMLRELDAYLRQRLLDYMCPRAFVILSSLPRTPNDKVDRNALREEVPISWTTGAEAGELTQASTATQRLLAEIVAEMMSAELQRLTLLKSQVAEEEERQPELPTVTWQQVDVARPASEQGALSLDSLDAQDFSRRVLKLCGVTLDNREFFTPLALVAIAVEFLLYQQAGENPPREKGGEK